MSLEDHLLLYIGIESEAVAYSWSKREREREGAAIHFCGQDGERHQGDTYHLVCTLLGDLCVWN